MGEAEEGEEVVVVITEEEVKRSCIIMTVMTYNDDTPGFCHLR